MDLQEIELDDALALGEQCAQIPQPVAAVFAGPAGSPFQIGEAMILRQVQQALQGADRLWAALLQQGLGPLAAGWAEQPAPSQQIVGAALDQRALVGMDVLRGGRKPARFTAGMDGDLPPA